MGFRQGDDLIRYRGVFDRYCSFHLIGRTIFANRFIARTTFLDPSSRAYGGECGKSKECNNF